ncbi:MAG: hypothetical protein U0167_10345 [bacterium]
MIVLISILLLTQVVMIATLDDYGTFVDEVWYFRAAWLIEDWVHRVAAGETSLRAPDPAVWEYNVEHPPFAKWVYAASDALLGPGVSQERYGADYDERVDSPGALRAPLVPGPLGPIAGVRAGALVFLLLAQIAAFRLAAAEAGPSAGLFAAAALPAMPHVFGHAHFACLDLPVAALELATLAWVARLARADRLGARRLLPLAALFGLGVATKLNALFLVGAIVPWVLLVAPRRTLVIAATLAIGAAILFYAVWPYLWTDPVGRLRHLVEFHLAHRTFPVYFFGTQYDGYTVPRTYLPAMLLLTTPIPFLVLAAAACVRVRRRHSLVTLLLLGAAASMLPFVALRSPVYDGVRHFLLAPLVVGVLAGVGFATLMDGAKKWLRADRSPAPRVAQAAPLLVGAALLGCGVWAVASVQPYPLAYYNAFVNGPRAGLPPPQGAGLESTCWGAEAVTPEVVSWINANLPERATIDWNAGSYTSLREYQRYGLLRADFTFAQGADYWVLETNQAYWTSRLLWKLFTNGQAGPYHGVKSFGLKGIDLVRIYQRAPVAQ